MPINSKANAGPIRLNTEYFDLAKASIEAELGASGRAELITLDDQDQCA